MPGLRWRSRVFIGFSQGRGGWWTRRVATATAVALVASLSPVLDQPRRAAAAPTANVVAPLVCPPSRPDVTAAAVSARLCGGRVEVTDLLSETTRVWANPDGTLTAEQHAAPVRIRRGAGWVPVDLTLERTADGAVAAKAHPAGLRLSGLKTDTGEHDIVSLGSGPAAVSVAWAGRLPDPVLAGTRATYADVLPSVDLVVEATRTGYKQFFVVKDRTGLAQVAQIPLVLKTGTATATSDGAGGVVFTDAKGVVLGRSPAPQMWDSAVDPASLEHVHRAPIGLALTAAGTGRTAAVLTPDAAFLARADLQFPVFVDPPATLGASFDAFVQTSYSSDQSTATELKLGTYNGGSDVARSYLQFATDQVWDQSILSARLNLWEYHAWSCTAASWQAFRAGSVSSSLRWTNQPSIFEQVGSSNLTTGYDSSCGDGWVDIDVTGAMQYAATNHSTTSTIMVRAGSETANSGWKRFNSTEAASGAPYISITYNAVPVAPWGPTIAPCYSVCDIGSRAASTHPTLSVHLHDDNYGQVLKAEFEVRNAATQATVDTSGLLSGTPAWIAGNVASWQVAATLVNATGYEWRARTNDGIGYGPWTGWIGFTVDTTAPGVPIVSSATYVNDGQPHGGAGVAGTFTFAPPGGTTDLGAFVYTLTSPSATLIPTTTLPATGSTNVSITPSVDGNLTLTVWAKDTAGNQSNPNTYAFKVGSAALAQPLPGARIARRTKVAVDSAIPTYTRAYFEYRRGPGGAVIAVPSANLTSATGTPIVATAASPVNLAGAGGYVVWSAADTLGATGGVVEIRAQLYTDTTGPVFATPWVRVTVDPDATGAAGTSVGPGSVNLLTGDYALSSTDTDDLGLTVARSASSRRPADGFVEQQERLTVNQQQVNAGTSGFDGGSANCVNLARVTTLGQGESGDSLEITPKTSCPYGPETFASIGGEPGGLTLGMSTGKTYRASGWIYVPAASTLTPDYVDRGLRIMAFYKLGGVWYGFASVKANYTDAWQELSVDLFIPAGATDAMFRLYNGFAANSGKKVYWDNISVKEIIAPFGPSWAGGATGGPTASPYTTLEFPQPIKTGNTVPSLAQVNLAGGGWITFSVNADGATYTPEPGAENLVLSKPDASTYRITDADGTVTDFTQQGAAWTVSSSSNTAQYSKTSYVYDTSNARALLTKVINPVEPGVDDTNHCTGASLPAGCEVLEYVYATATTGGLSQTVFGDYVDHVKQVKLWNSDPSTGTVSATVVAEYRYDVDGELREVWDPRVSPALKTAYDYGTRGRVTSLTPPGELAWQFAYANPDVDTATLRLDFAEGAGNAVADTSGNSVATTVTGTLGWGEGNAGAAPTDTGLALSGTAVSVSAPTATLATNQSFTVSAWVNSTEQANNWRDAVAKDGATAFGFQLGWDGAVGNWGFAMATSDTMNPGAVRARATATPTRGTWTHLTGVYDHSAGQLRLYVNGVLQATASYTSTWNASGPLLVGRSKYNTNLGNYWIGGIDDVRTYQKALTADQIANLAGDDNSGRLLRVQRTTLLQGSPTTTDGTIATNVVYHVPLTTTAGGPYNLDPTTAATWGQTDLPTDATALFGPEDTPSVNSATPTAPGSSGYPYATVSYLNANGQQVNTATPGAHIDTTEYDKFGNPTRTLQATDREIALGTHPQATQYLNDLGLTSLTTAARAQALSTMNTYSSDGLDLLTTTGPTMRVVLQEGLADPDGAGPLPAITAGATVLARAHTVNAYDQNKPDGATYHLLTTTTSGAAITGYPDGDARTTTNAYDAVKGGTLGWTLRKPTTVVADAGAGGAALTSYVVYDSQGRATESWGVGATGTDARTAKTIYYTAGTNSADAACGNTPKWAGQPCVTKKAGAVTGHDAARMATYLPERRITSYSQWGDAAVITETVPGTTASRTTTTTFDGAGRISQVALTSANDGATAIPTISTTYSATTGQVTQTQAGASGPTIVREYDSLGRLYRYTDAEGAVTTNEFDRYGKPSKVTDPTGNATFTYNRSLEPRGLLTSVTDSIAGTFSASYSPDGQLTALHYPNGMTRTDTLDANLETVARVYTRDTDSAVIYTDAVVTNSSGAAVNQSATGGSRVYSYDHIGRLTATADTIDGEGCTTRTYTYDTRTNRTSRKTYNPDGAGNCRSTGTVDAQADHTYDSADRITDTGYTYDAFGRVTAMAGGLTNTFYANDLVNQQILDTNKQTWTLDPKNRLRAFTTATYNGSSWTTTASRLNHYSDDSDSPRWIIEDTGTGALTRMIPGPDGVLAATTSATGNAQFTVANLHGDLITTLDATLLPPGFNHYDEFGNPATGQAQTRYGWLGGKQRSAETLGGTILMGVRLYHPDTGRFLQPDPVDGGSATTYDYCNADPVNDFDLAGTWPNWGAIKSVVSVVAKVAEVASFIPGPIGAAAAAISSVSYAVTGNYAKAGEMALTAAANLVGCGAVVKVAVAAVAAVKVAKVGLAAAAVVGKTAKIARTIHANSYEYTGLAHTYKIIDTWATGADRVYKYGKGTKLLASGESARALQQIRRLNGGQAGRFVHEVTGRFAGTLAARTAETRMIRGFYNMFGRRPLGNKTFW